MFQELVSHNDDLKRLLEKGYALAFDSGYLVIRDIPFLDSQRALKAGAIVTKLTMADRTRIAPPDDHQIFFCGSPPCNIDGTPIPNLADRPAQLTLAKKDIVVERQFSNRPSQGFTNFFDKIESYRVVICGPAEQAFGATPFTFRFDEDIPGSVFKFHDTLTSRAELGDLAAKLKDDVIAIIGLGGTGAYILDFMTKTPVKEIRAFDPDMFHVHNAFRSPGKLSEAELDKPKAEVYQSRYDSFRTGLTFAKGRIEASSDRAIEGVTFAFVCVDKGSSRFGIFDLLIAKGIPFIDVGLGLNRKRHSLNGMVRATFYSSDTAVERRKMELVEMADAPDDEYRVNIQTSELNALNAAIAVLKYKQTRGFYFDDNSSYHTVFQIGDLRTFGI